MNIGVQISSVVKRFKKQEKNTLDNVSFNIQAGSKTGILGPNGAGKTTLISIICGLISPTSGAVQFFQNGENNCPDIKHQMGLIPQEYAFYDRLTPEQNLRFFGVLYSIDKDMLSKRIDLLLKQLGLQDVRKKRVKRFSGGMKRRLNLAIGLIHNPGIVFLDEPTVGIDVQSKHAILKFLNQMNEEGKTLVYTSHHLNEAQNFCDHVVLLDHGQILVDSPMSQMIEENDNRDLQSIFIDKTGGQLRDQIV